MIKITAIFTILLFASCSTEPKQTLPTLSQDQIHIAEQYRQIDSLLHKPLDSLELHLEKMEAAAKSQTNEYKAMTLIGYSMFHLNKSAHVLAENRIEQALKLLKNSKADSLVARSYSILGALYKNTGEHQKAFKFLYKAQQIFERRDDKKGIAIVNGNIAQIYLQKNDPKLAQDHLKISMNALSHNKSHYAYMNSLHTLANIHGMAGDYETALKIDDDGIRIADSIHSPKLKAPFLDNKANCYLYSNRLDSADYYFNECLKIDIAAGNPKQIADTYSNLGTLALFRKDYEGAEQNVMKGIALLKDVDHKPNLLKSYEVLSDIYRQSGKLEQALEAKNAFLDIYQKMMNEKKEAAMAEYKIVHETEQKEKIIAQNRIDLLVKEREVKQRNHLLIGISLLAFFIALTGWLIYRQQRLKNRQQVQEYELKTAISQIETQNKLQEQRLSISRDLHDNIGAQLTFIISSVDNIRYAFDLKDTKLEHRLNSINNFTKSTIIELRDTIWAMNHSEITFEDLRIRIFNFIEKAKDAKEEIEFKFDIDIELSAIKLTSIVGMNVYRTIQEAVNNAVKYSSASQISISIRRSGGQIAVTIEDDGIGFEPDLASRGNGLSNMKKRISDIDGNFRIASVSKQGTKIDLRFEIVGPVAAIQI